MKKRIVAVLACLAILVCAIAGGPAVARAETTSFPASDLSLFDVDGTTTTLNGNLYGGTKRIVIVGRTNCLNTQAEVASALKLSAKDAYRDINFIVLDYDSGREDFIETYGPMETEHVRFFSDDSTTYKNWAHNTLDKAGGSGSSLPFVFIIDENNRVIYGELGPQSIPVLCEEYLGIKNPDGATALVHGYVDTQAGMELLELVNQARAAVGVAPLVWDADLAQTAIQRVTETAMYWSHYRPDGSECFTAWPSWSAGGAENIAAGQTSVQQVNTSWTNSSGHYANMIRADMKCFAAALYVGSDGETYWVECFATPTGANGVDMAVAENIASTVYFDTANATMSVRETARSTVAAGDSFQMEMPRLCSADLVGTGLIWSSSDPSVFTVSSAGVVTGVSKGSATLTVALESNPDCKTSRTVWVTDKDASKTDIDGATVSAIPNQLYTGSAIKPEVTLTLGGKTLVEGTDYEVYYDNNYDVGTGSIMIYGEGDYTGSKTVYFYIVRPIVPYIATQPEDFQGPAGGTATFNVVASSATSLTYRWQESADNGVTWSDCPSSLAGYNTASLSMPATAARDGYLFRCVVTNADGFSSTSHAAGLFIVTDGTIARGVWGTCPWDISDAGVLTVHPGEGATQTGSNISPWDEYAADITSVVFATEGGEKVIAPVNITCLLADLNKMTSADMSGLDTSGTSNMNAVFYRCTSLERLDLSTFDTSSVAAMEYMFYYCMSLASLDLSGWDTHYVYDMADMFRGCSSLTELDVSHFDTHNVEYMEEMFYGCSSVTSLDLSNWNTKYVSNQSSMFSGCDSLVSISVGENVTSGVLRQLPTTVINGHNDWCSLADGQWYFVSEIATYRTGIADTYQKWQRDPYNLEESGKIKAADMCYSGKEELPNCEVLFRGWDLVKDQDYTIEFVGDTVNVGTIQIIVTGINDYTGTITSTYDIYPESMEYATITVEEQEYTGQAIEPHATVVVRGVTLVEDRDYTLRYDNNVEIGGAWIYVDGIGNYQKTKSGRFDIVPIDISRAVIETYNGFTYTGEAQVSPVTVTVDGKELTIGPDYLVSYSNNVNAGEAVVTVTGNGYYRGTATATYTIHPVDLSDKPMTVQNQTYTGSPLTPSVTISCGNLKPVAGTDYTLTYANNTGPGTASVTVKGQGNYTGGKTLYFEITKAAVKTGWQKIDGVWYYLDSVGKPMTNHWESWNGSWYYFGADGKLVRTGWAVAYGKYYYIKNYSFQKTGWVYYNGYYFYLKNYNPVVNDWVKWNGTWYHFNGSGICDGTW